MLLYRDVWCQLKYFVSNIIIIGVFVRNMTVTCGENWMKWSQNTIKWPWWTICSLKINIKLFLYIITKDCVNNEMQETILLFLQNHYTFTRTVILFVGTHGSIPFDFLISVFGLHTLSQSPVHQVYSVPYNLISCHEVSPIL